MRTCFAALIVVSSALGCADKGDNDGLDTVEREDTATADDDCDGENTPSTWYVDADADGYGDSELSAEACEAPEGHVAQGGDCDDADPQINPGATEVCDEADTDEDCNGLADDEDPGVDRASQSTWYPDADGDGYGDADAAEASCEDPSDEALTWTDDLSAADCNDLNATVYPGAPEICEDGLVNDCDSDVATAAAACTWDSSYTTSVADLTLTASSPVYLPSVLSRGDFDADGVSDVVLGASWSSHGSLTENGGVYVHFGPLSADAAMTADTVIHGAASADYLGVAAVGVEDLDGDRYDELLLGAPGQDSGGSKAGAAYLIQGPFSSASASALAHTTYVGADADDQAGTALSWAGDVDGDGVGDLLVGAAEADRGLAYSGVVYLVSGALSGNVDLGRDAEAEIYGAAVYETLGRGDSLTTLGDIDGDGLADFAMGTIAYDGGAEDAGGVLLFQGPVSGVLDLDDADGAFFGSATNAGLGLAVRGGHDHDGDGTDDLYVGEPLHSALADEAGALFVITSDLWTREVAQDVASLSFRSSLPYDLLAGNFDVGDTDGDGSPDLLVGTGYVRAAAGSASTGVSGSGTGRAYLLLGPKTGALSLSDAHTTFTGDDAYFGVESSFLGDLNGDGNEDIGILRNTHTTADPGQLFVYLSTSY